MTLKASLGIVGALVVAVGGAAFWRSAHPDPALVASVRRGSLTATLAATGTLRPVQSTTYRSPVPGREMDIVELAPEGAHVREGDLLVRFDTTDLVRDLGRYRQDVRQTEVDVQLAEGELEEAEANITSVAEGEGALGVAEARAHLQAAERKAERLRQEYAELKPLMDKGFMTRDELAKTADALEQAEEDLTLARRRTGVVADMTHPREEKRAELQRAQKTSVLAHARTNLLEAQSRLAAIARIIDSCTLYAGHGGLVVYEELLGANPRRKVRIGDRVFPTQGVVTIPEVDRMLVDASISEGEVHRVKPGQKAQVRIEAFPDLRLTGQVSRVGTLASTSAFRALDDKRFDLVVTLDPASADLRPEMTARADVEVGKRDNVLLIPVTAVFKRQGLFVAYVIGATGMEPRPIELGESNGDVAEVVSGLREGDTVSLIEPATMRAASPSSSSSSAPAGLLQRAAQPR